MAVESTDSQQADKSSLIKRFRWPIVGVALIVAAVGFYLFRPDTLFIDDTVDESLEDAFADLDTTVPPAATDDESDDSDEDESDDNSTPATSTTPASEGPVAVSTGDFYGIDHSAEGTATVYEQGGRYVLRFEDDTDIQNGPDLFVWVLPTDSYDGGDPTEFIDLGKLTGNVGGQNYELPAEFDPEEDEFVLIWCKRFGVPFAASPLAAA